MIQERFEPSIQVGAGWMLEVPRALYRREGHTWCLVDGNHAAHTAGRVVRPQDPEHVAQVWAAQALPTRRSMTFRMPRESRATSLSVYGDSDAYLLDCFDEEN